MFGRFREIFGRPSEGTASTAARPDSPELAAFVRDVGGGIFCGGLLSLVSVREEIESYGGWEQRLPDGARLFGMSAFGWLFFTSTGEDLWLVDTQENDVVDSRFSITEFIADKLVEERTRAVYLMEPLWRSWGGVLDTRRILAPAPAIALGGTWSKENLHPVSLVEFLALQAGVHGFA
jgi:hypothetical protein